MGKILDFVNKKCVLYILAYAFALYFLYRVRGILPPFILGFFIAYIFKNLVKKYENKIPRHWLSLIIISLFTIFIVLICLFAIPALFNQLISLLREIISKTENIDFDILYNKIYEIARIFKIDDVKELQKHFLTASNFIVKYLGNLTNSLIASSLQILYGIFVVCISPIIAFYFLRDWDKMFNFIREHFISNSFKKHYLKLSSRIDDILHHYIIGQINVSLILGLFYSVGLLLIDFRYAFIVGIFSGILTLLPYVGAFGGAFISLILGYFQYGSSVPKLVSIGVVFSVGQFLEGNFITPNLIGNKIQVHPLWLFFGILAGGALYGFWGIVISMPLAGILGVLVRFYFEEKAMRDKYDINNR